MGIKPDKKYPPDPLQRKNELFLGYPTLEAITRDKALNPLSVSDLPHYYLLRSVQVCPSLPSLSTVSALRLYSRTFFELDAATTSPGFDVSAPAGQYLAARNTRPRNPRALSTLRITLLPPHPAVTLGCRQLYKVAMQK